MFDDLMASEILLEHFHIYKDGPWILVLKAKGPDVTKVDSHFSIQCNGPNQFSIYKTGGRAFTTSQPLYPKENISLNELYKYLWSVIEI